MTSFLHHKLPPHNFYLQSKSSHILKADSSRPEMFIFISKHEIILQHHSKIDVIRAICSYLSASTIATFFTYLSTSSWILSVKILSFWIQLNTHVDTFLKFGHICFIMWSGCLTFSTETHFRFLVRSRINVITSLIRESLNH